MTDAYQPYRDMLDGKQVPIHADQPYPGRYRMKRGDRFVSVLINFDREGVLRARVGTDVVDAASVWTFCAKHPVSKGAFDTFEQTGSWPGDAPEIGHNSGDLSLAEQVREYADLALSWLRKVGGVKDKISADMAANYRAKLNELKKEADSARTTEKAPHLAKAREVDDKWRVPIAEAGDAAEEIRAALTAFMVAEEKRLKAEAEAKRKAEEERLAKERARIEAERAKRMEDDPALAMLDDEPELPMVPSEPEPVKVQAGGQRGRKTGLRSVTVYDITDYDAALAHVKSHPDVVAAVEKVARAQAKAGADVPGVTARVDKVAA